MKAIDRKYFDIINGAKQFIIPVFQRDYSWTELKCDRLWQDVIEISGKDAESRHFLGSIVSIDTGDSSPAFSRWLLIDGQQRVTTITLLMAALRDYINETGWKGGEESPTVRRIESYFLRNFDEEGDREQKLLLRRHDQETLRALIADNDIPDNASEQLLENYEFFKELLQEADPDEIYTGICKLAVVDVTLHRGMDDPQLIFESLNSTGMDLSQSDLIRNFLLMGLPEEEQSHLYDIYWRKIEKLFRSSENVFDGFIRDYMALKTKASKQEKAGEIYRSFSRECIDLKETLGGLDELLKDMLRFAQYHAEFSIGGLALPSVNEALSRLNSLVDAPAVLIIQLADHNYRNKSLSEEEYIEALNLIESYVFRRIICGEQTRGYWQVFSNMAYKIEEDSPLESLKVELARQRDAYKFPSDEEFRRELLERDIYALRVRKHLLDSLENFESREPSDTNQYSIEHIMPQNEKLRKEWRKMLGPKWSEIQDEWLHRLGNLTLTAYNSSYSDLPFEEKKTISGGFAESAVRLNKYVREQPVWTAKEIEKRGKQLAKRALKIWPSLDVESALIDAANRRDMKELAKKRDISKVIMSEQAKNLFEQLRGGILDLGPEIIELAETKSISYHNTNFFLEVLPRKYRLMLLLPLDFNEVDDPEDIVMDASEWTFFTNAKYQGDICIYVDSIDDISLALPIIRQAYTMCGS